MMKLNPRKRSSSRRRSSGGGGGLGGVKGAVKEAFGKTVLGMGIGLFATGVAYNVFIAKTSKATTDAAGKTTYSSSLPLGNDQIGGLLYGIGVPVLIGFLTRKRFPNFSKGAYLYSVSSLINTYVGPAVKQEIDKLTKVQAGSAYIRRGTNLAGVGRLPGPNNHTAINQFGGPGQAPMPRLTNAWAKS